MGTQTNLTTQSVESQSDVISLRKVAPAEDLAVPFLEAAQELPAADVLPCRRDVYAAITNLSTGFASLNQPAALARIREQAPRFDTEALLQLPALGRAVLRQTEKIPPVPRDAVLAAAMTRGLEVSKILEPQIKVLVGLHRVAAKEAHAVRKGRGKSNLGASLLASAELLANCGEPTALPSGLVEEARALGVTIRERAGLEEETQELQRLRSGSLELRDRLWTLLVRRHGEARRLAGFLWGKQADELVPPLCSTKRARKARQSSVPVTNASAEQPAE